ncbi:MAG: hypothetical protein RDO_0410 [Flavobacteriales endosymbiont of Rhyzopertha dominica]|nr:MAG: DUF4290 domain-containing protein [Candidatus Shikimatogenerans bostrichidophilus]
MKINNNKIINFPEYGENINKLIKYVININDKEIRKKNILNIIKLMKLINPIYLNKIKNKYIIWEQLYLLIKYNFIKKIYFKRNIKKKKKYNYKNNKVIKYKYYGTNIIKFIKEIKNINFKNKKSFEDYIYKIKNIMKNNYIKWNNSNNNIRDNKIIKDINKIGKLKIDI